MSENPVSFLEIDEVKITIIMDNPIDVLMNSSQVAKRPPPENKDLIHRTFLRSVYQVK
jgi:hypothetical protein